MLSFGALAIQPGNTIPAQTTILAATGDVYRLFIIALLDAPRCYHQLAEWPHGTESGPPGNGDGNQQRRRADQQQCGAHLAELRGGVA